MPSYLIETYLARGDMDELEARGRRATEAAEALTDEKTPVKFERSIHVITDEICFFVFDAPSRGDAALAARRAGLDPLRVVEAISSTAPPARLHPAKQIEENS